MWLMHYADVAGDHSPMDLVTYLPKGRKSCYFAMYLRDRGSMGREAASLNTFLAAWRTELPWLKVASSLCNFVRCGVFCDYLKDLVDRCPRHSKEYMAALTNRLGEHFAMQSAQRLAQYRLGEMHSVWGPRLVYEDRQDGPERSVAPNEMVPIEHFVLPRREPFADSIDWFLVEWTSTVFADTHQECI